MGILVILACQIETKLSTKSSKWPNLVIPVYQIEENRQKKPDGQEQERVPSPRYTKALVRKAAPAT
jgi:hypothetical protein